MSKKNILIILGVLGVILIVFMGIQSRNHMYKEKSVFSKSDALHVMHQKKVLEKQLERSKKYYDAINHVITKLQLDDVGEIPGPTDNKGISQNEFVSQFFASTLLDNEQLFLAYMDPNVLLNDKDNDLSSDKVKKIMNQISKNKFLQEVYIQSKTLKDDSNFEVTLLLTYTNNEDKQVKLSVSKVKDFHNKSNGFFTINTPLSDISKQLINTW